MKHNNFPLVLLVIVLILALAACIYVSNAIPSFNGVVDTLLADVISLIKTPETDVSPEAVTTVAVPEKKTASSKKASQNDLFEFTERGYTLASAGKNRWLYESSWPFVTTPVICNETIITTTAEPAFLILSYETGELLSKQDCPVYPGETASLDGNILSLTGRDRQQYLFRIEDDYSFTDLRGEEYSAEDEETGKTVNSLLANFTPGKEVADFIAGRIKEWTADEEVKPLPDVKLYTGHINQEGNGNFWAEENNGGETCVYVFTPDKQGIYQMGLADENGAWLKADAFVAVFGENGELKQVSIDYVANKPQIKLHLSDTEIYFLVTGWACEKYDGTRTWLQIAESR
ncbi:MAG: hypothetical protein KBT02_12335 [Treponema sp.]|nr:hypothetical protein [Candidatus Treponema caballi]